MTTQDNQITEEDICTKLVSFIKEMEVEDIQTVCERGGFIWFTWQGVALGDLELQLQLGDPANRANREFLDRSDIYISYIADQFIFELDGEDGFFYEDEGGEPCRADDDYFERARAMMIEDTDRSANDAWNIIESGDQFTQ